MRKRVRIALGVLLLSLAGVIAWQLLRPGQNWPVYQGKDLRVWLQEYRLGLMTGIEERVQAKNAAEVAVRQMGTNAIPSLLRMLRARDSAVMSKMISLWDRWIIAKDFLPAWVRRPSWYRNQAAFLNDEAALGFEILGAHAQQAAPTLVEIYDQNISWRSQASASQALIAIGPAARIAIPSLVRSADSSHEAGRSTAVMALSQVQVEPQLVVPALAKSLSDTNIFIRVVAARGLANFGAEAQPAIPALARLLTDANVQIRYAATNALRKIEEALRTKLILNEDDSHFFGSRSAEQMTRDGLHAFVDQYADSAVTHLFLCPNAMKASYRSKARDAIWDLSEGQKPPPEDFAKKWVDNARLLDERGLDPYAVWIARCREKKISPWLSMRMNDVHNADDVDNYIHSSFWRKHPDYWRVPGGRGWTDRALDYGIPEVREHAMAFIRELLERYDPDGLELDWMRFGYHFRPGKEAEGAALLTQFMRDARRLTRDWSEKRGHPTKLGARVPTHPDAAIGLGLDGVTWVRERLVDMLVPTPFWATTDFDIPLELWRERIGTATRNVVLAAGAEILVRPYPSAKPIEADLTSTRGFAAACLGRGADCIYLFNYMDPAPMTGGKDVYRALLEEGLRLESVTRRPRRHVVTYHDTVAPGMSSEVVLPQKGPTGGAFRIYTGPAPKNADVFVVGGLESSEGMAQARFEITVNERTCAPESDLTDLSLFAGVARAVRHRCPVESLRDGYNDVRLRQLPGSPEQKIVWAELRIVPRE